MPKRIADLPAEYALHQRAVASAIGVRVRLRRERLQLTQEQLRARMELEQVAVARTRLSRIELGDVLPNAAEVVALCAALDVGCAWLLAGHSE